MSTPPPSPGAGGPWAGWPGWLSRVRRLWRGPWWLDERQRHAVRRTLSERSSFPVSVHHADGRVMWGNSAFERLCGRGAGQCRGQSLDQLLQFSQGDPAAFQQLNTYLNGDTEGRVQLCGTRQGQVVWLLAEVLQLPSFAGQETKALIHWFDQTEPMQTQQRLQTVLSELTFERQRLGHILAGSQVGAWEVNLITGEARMDEAWAQMFGHTRAELQPWSRERARDMLHPDDRAKTDLQVRRHMAGELAGVDVEQRVRHRDGHWLWVHSRGRIATRTADGQPEWLSGTHMDISERKQQQAELEAQRAYTRQVLSSLPGVVFEFELDEQALPRCTYLSDGLYAMFGIEPAAALQNTQLLFQTVPQEDLDALHAAVRASARDLTLLEAEYRVTHGKALRWLGIHAKPSRQADGRLSWHGMLLDVTRRHELADQLLRARHDAEEANRAKSAFLATMSHEIRSPMNGVLGMADVLANATRPEDQADAVQTIRESASSLLGLIDDILDFSKIEAGRLELECLSFNPGQLLESVVESLASGSAAEQVSVDVRIAPGLPQQFWGDPTRIRQILHNLVSNAIKFSRSEAQGKGRVRSSVMRADAPEAGLVFRVEDEGIGIDEAALSRLFQPFTQADASTTRRYGGTGLGLAIVRRLVDAMLGHIRVDSHPGLGTRFDVWLPLAVSDPSLEPPSIDLSGVSCLILAEDAEAAASLGPSLCAAGAEVNLLPSLAALASWRPAQPEARTVLLLPHRGSTATALEQLPQWLAWRQAGVAELRCLVVALEGRPQSMQLAGPDIAVLRTLRRQSLWRAVATLAGRASPEAQTARLAWVAGADAPPVDRQAAQASGRLVLVVDDDATNRKVAQRQLQLLGLLAEVAVDGEEAFAMWQQGGHALVLTDLHMPRCDGYSLAARIRAAEAQQQRPRTPLLALSANALQGEKRRAQQAGLDDYLVKPIPMESLQAALQRWMPALAARDTPLAMGAAPAIAAAGAPGAAPAPAPLAGTVLAPEVLRQLVGDEPALLDELMGEFRRAFESGSTAIGSALARADEHGLAAAAHKLKSACRAVGAMQMAQLCEQLETGGSHQAWRPVFEQASADLRQALCNNRETSP